MARRRNAVFARVAIGLLALAALASLRATTIAWDGGTTGGGTAWLTATNWNPDTIPGANDIADFATAGTASGIGINLSGSTNNGTNNQAVGAIELLSTRSRTIGDSSNNNVGTLTLNGATVNSVANVILRNASSFNLTIQNSQGGNPNTVMDVALGNATDNVINIDGTGGITISSVIKNGAANANLTLGGSGSGVLTFSGSAANTYSGTTTVNSSELDLNKTAGVNAIAGNLTIGDGSGTDTVKLLASNQISDASNVTINSSGVFNLNQKSEAIDGLSSSSSTSSVTIGAGVLTVGANDGTATFAGVISGLGGTLNKNGTGTETLTGSNTFSGAVAVNNGTLNAAANGALGATEGSLGITVNSGGTLMLSNSSATNRINNSATIQLAGGTFGRSGVGTVSEGAGAHRNGVTVTGTSSVGLGALSLTSNSFMDFNLLNTGGVGTFTFTTFTPNNHTLDILNWNSSATVVGLMSGTDGVDDRLIFNSDQTANLAFFSFNGTAAAEIPLDTGFYEIVPIPEPGTWFAAALALGAIGYSQRKRFLLSHAAGDTPTHRTGSGEYVTPRTRIPVLPSQKWPPWL